MFRTKDILSLLTILLVSYSIINGQVSDFTFQGKIYQNGAPVSTPRDMKFNLFRETTPGSMVQIATQTINNVAVHNGVFTVLLDFGSSGFNGQTLWVEIGIYNIDLGDFEILPDRQKVTSVPYSIRAVSAATAINSMQLGGFEAEHYVQTGDARLSDERQPLSGSAYYIQNQSSSAQTGNFQINGTGRANFFDATRYRINGMNVLHTDGTNIVVGPDAGVALSGGSNNSFVGVFSGNQNSTGNFNTFTGSYSGQNTTSGADNSFYGGQSGRNNLTGGGNSFYGRFSGFINNTGSQNSFFGLYAGTGNTSGNNNTAIGSYADVSSNTLSFATAIGSYSRVQDDNTIVIGKVAGTYNGVERPADAVIVPGSLSVAGTFGSDVLSAVTQLNISSDRVLSVAGSQNLFVGVNAGQNNIGEANTFVGRGAGRFNTTGNNNSFFGRGAGVINSTGGGNSFYGNLAGTSNTTGNSNAFFGNTSGSSNTTASANSFFGSGSGISNLTGGLNAFIGYNSGQSNETGASNVFIGGNAGLANITGNWNTFVGGSVGLTNQTGSGITLLGYQANVAADSLLYATAIGAQSEVTGSDTIVLGKSAGTYGGISRPADTVIARGPIDTLAQYNLKGNRFMHTGPSTTFGNTFLGNYSGNSITTGTANTSFGLATGQNLTTGSHNSYFGLSSGSSVNTGDFNSFYGTSSGGQTTTGRWNTFVGSVAGFSNVLGSGNIMVGTGADFINSDNSGNFNIAIGYQSKLPTGHNNSIAIGAYSTVMQSNSLVLGSILGYNGAPSNTNVGIGTPEPKEKLHIANGRVYVDNPGQGVILRSPNGTCYELRVANNGVLTTNLINPCP